MKQWGIATHLYAFNNENYLPQDGTPNGRSVNAGWYVNLPEAIGLAPYHK